MYSDPCMYMFCDITQSLEPGDLHQRVPVAEYAEQTPSGTFSFFGKTHETSENLYLRHLRIQL